MRTTRKRVFIEERALLALVDALFDPETEESAQGKHLTEKEFQFYLGNLDESGGRTLFEIDNHLDACLDCQEALKTSERNVVLETQRLARLVDVLLDSCTTESLDGSHLSKKEVQYYLGNTDQRPQRTLFEIDDHLDSCGACQEALEELPATSTTNSDDHRGHGDTPQRTNVRFDKYLESGEPPETPVTDNFIPCGLAKNLTTNQAARGPPPRRQRISRKTG